MRFLLKLLLTAVFIMVIGHFFHLIDVRDSKTAIIVALVLALLNSIVKPILVILTLPVTVVTLGLFLLVINAAMVMLTAEIVGPAFHVNGWTSALLFSLMLSVFQYLIEKLIKKNDK